MIISLFQTKGGTGKTTSAFVLAEILSKWNSVTVIDADPNTPFKEWKDDGGEGEKFKIVVPDIDPDDPDNAKKFALMVRSAAAQSAFVIIDNEGSRNQTAARSIALSDLVIVPTDCGPLDNKHASKAIKYIRKVGKQAGGRQIPFRVLLTKQKAVAQSRTMRQGLENMVERGIPMFATPLIERDTFRAIFAYNVTLANIDPTKVNEPHKGQLNARAFAIEVARTLKDIKAEEGAKTSAPAAAEKETANA